MIDANITTPRTDHVLQNGIDYTDIRELVYLCKTLERELSIAQHSLGDIMKHTAMPIHSDERLILDSTDLLIAVTAANHPNANEIAAHIVRCVNAFPELVAALEMCAATVELHTGNGAQSQPAWPRDKNGDIDYEAVSSIARAALAKARA